MTGTRARTLAIDWTRCDGHGLCAELLPGRIALDEWGFPILHRAAVDTAVDASVDASEERDVRRAVAACPALALRLER